MHADRTDAPSRFRRRSRHPFPWAVPLLFALPLTAAALYLSAGHVQSTQQAASNADAITRHNEQIHARQLVRLQGNGSEVDNENNWIRRGDATPQTDLDHRQTSFSDANYVPQAVRNVVPAMPIVKEPYKPRPTRQQIVIVGKADPRLSDYCLGAKGSIQLRNCKAYINLNTRNR